MMAGKHYKCQLHTYHYLSLSYLQHKHNILTLKHVSVHIFHFEKKLRFKHIHTHYFAPYYTQKKYYLSNIPDD